ncbi:MAG TPA: hypothetical protein VF144_15410 [Chitinophagaceae bacterium]
MKKPILILILSVFYMFCSGQDSSTRRKYELNGYIKDMQSVVFTNDFRNADYTNLIHNRINFKWKPSQKVTGAIEIRNRFYWGSDARTIVRDNQNLQGENEKADLSANWYSHGNKVFYSNVDRLWMDYRSSKWNFRAGRHRVNWGMTSVWNPNDIFNSYNFLDFDYEERPGCDAVKAQYMINDMSNIEATISAAGNGEAIMGAKYFFNKSGYDLQFISGFYHNSFTGGFGWAGNISEFGYKGEVQFYINKIDSLNSLNATMEGDYIFQNGWYINLALLYNEQGLNAPVSGWTDIKFKISPDNLMPAKWNFLTSTSKQFNSLFSGNLAIVYSPGINMLIFFPSFNYNLSPHFDLDFVWQSFFLELNKKFRGVAHAGFLRVKWSF